uniref:Annexin 6 n=1 Tax=Spironucleus vortens TaxID=58336 RepID=A0A142C674_SPIVO|nr:annexin 6 [Spironucleus vortens]
MTQLMYDLQFMFFTEPQYILLGYIFIISFYQLIKFNIEYQQRIPFQMSCCASPENIPIVQTPFTDRGNPEPSKIQRIVEDIVKACKGLGTDEKKLISVTGECTGIERDAVSELYTKTYNKTLHGLFKSELSGKFEKMFLAMYTTRYVFWAEQIKEAVKGAGMDEKKLIDLLVSTGSEYAEVDRVFTQLYKKCIYETLSSECGNSCWGKLMKAFITNKRVAGNAQTIAEKLHKAAKGAGTDEKTFIELLTTTDQQTSRWTRSSPVPTKRSCARSSRPSSPARRSTPSSRYTTISSSRPASWPACSSRRSRVAAPTTTS